MDDVCKSGTRYKGELLRIGTQCGITDHEALGKFIKIISKRIDAAYEMGKAEGVAQIRKSDYDKAADEYYATRDHARETFVAKAGSIMDVFLDADTIKWKNK